ncbi:MAG: tetratricopeptide repeat protein [Thiohalospira sp.]
MRHLLLLFVCLYTFQGFSQNENKYFQLELAILNEQYDSAIYYADQMLSEDSLDWKVYYYKGKSNLAKNKYFDALENFQKANRIDTANYLIENSLAKLYDFIGQNEKAINIYYDQYLRDTTRLEPIESLADILRRNGEYSSAIHYYQKGIAIDGTNFNYFKQLGFCLKQINLKQPAIYSYQNALKLNPYDLSAYKQLANLQNAEKFFSRALETCNKGLKIYPDDIQLKKLLAYSHYLNKNFDSSIVIFNDIISLGDTTFFSYKYLGFSYFELQEFNKAVDILLQAAELVNNDEKVYFYLGSAYGRSGNHEKGIENLNRALKIMEPPAKELSTIYAEFAEIYTGMGKYNLAIEHLKLAYSYNPKPILSFKLGQLYDLYLKDKKLALTYYDGYLTLINRNDSIGEETEKESNIYQKDLIKYIGKRVQVLKEELFFETEQKEKQD